MHKVTVRYFRQQLLDTIAANQVVLLVGSPPSFVALFDVSVKVVHVDIVVLFLQAKLAVVHPHHPFILKPFEIYASLSRAHTRSHTRTYVQARFSHATVTLLPRQNNPITTVRPSTIQQLPKCFTVQRVVVQFHV